MWLVLGLFLLLTAAAAPAAHGFRVAPRSPGPYILNGQEADPGEWPHQVRHTRVQLSHCQQPSRSIHEFVDEEAGGFHLWVSGYQCHHTHTHTYTYTHRQTDRQTDRQTHTHTHTHTHTCVTPIQPSGPQLPRPTVRRLGGKSTSCALRPRNHQIKPAEPASGFQCSLRSFGHHVCGAVYLTDVWLVTAAHCVAGTNP